MPVPAGIHEGVGRKEQGGSVMPRFAVSATPDAEDELADILMNSPPALQQEVTRACNRIDSLLVHADLLPNYVRRGGLVVPFKIISGPLQAIYRVDEQAREV